MVFSAAVVFGFGFRGRELCFEDGAREREREERTGRYRLVCSVSAGQRALTKPQL